MHLMDQNSGSGNVCFTVLVCQPERAPRLTHEPGFVGDTTPTSIPHTFEHV